MSYILLLFSKTLRLNTLWTLATKFFKVRIHWPPHLLLIFCFATLVFAQWSCNSYSLYRPYNTEYVKIAFLVYRRSMVMQRLTTYRGCNHRSSIAKLCWRHIHHHQQQFQQQVVQDVHLHHHTVLDITDQLFMLNTDLQTLDTNWSQTPGCGPCDRNSLRRSCQSSIPAGQYPQRSGRCHHRSSPR